MHGPLTLSTHGHNSMFVHNSLLGHKSLLVQHILLVGLDGFLKQLLVVACLLGTLSFVGHRLFGLLTVALLGHKSLLFRSSLFNRHIYKNCY